MTTYIYLRVSTTTQDEKAQQIGITKYLADNNITETQQFIDKVSGSTTWQERKLITILQAAQKGDKLIVSELSRIGRSTADVLTFLEHAAIKGLHVVAVKNNITLDGSIQSTIFATVLGLAAEIERDFIKSRTREGMQKAKEAGKKIGRPSGRAKTVKLDKVGEQIQTLMTAQIAKTAIARLLKVSRGTVDRFIKRQELK
jgi:DNA invertase Pin-like site-specific DNA recombinase